MINCETCKHKDKLWYEEPCDSCCKAHSGYEKVFNVNGKTIPVKRNFKVIIVREQTDEQID